MIFFRKIKNLLKRITIRNYILSLNNNTDDPGIIEMIYYFKKYKFPICSLISYEFSKKYNASDITVFFDNILKTNYVMHDNKKLYFPENWENKNIRIYYNCLCIEQDKDSPHCYEADEYIVQEGDVIADVGAAEGIWALDNAEKAGKIYLFESNQEWIKALQKTFEPWKEKVVIVDKYVSDTNDDENITLDVFFNNKSINFIKADIEGMEIKLLKGMKILLNNNNLKLLLCAYHSNNDGTEIIKILEKNSFKTEYSKRYMLVITDQNLEKPYIRRGLVRAMKSILY